MLAVVQIGDRESDTRQIKKFKKECEAQGIEFLWYYFKDEKQLEIDGNDLEEYADLVAFWDDDRWTWNGIADWARDTMDLACSTIVYVGEKGMDLSSEGAIEVVIPKNSCVNRWNYLTQADLIVTSEELNCYSLYTKIIDLGGKCINIEDRNVLSSYDFKKRGILNATYKR